MTMGFRNRPTPGRARYDASPMTGRIVVGVVCIATMLAPIWIWPLICLFPLAGCGLYGTLLKPELFE